MSLVCSHFSGLVGGQISLVGCVVGVTWVGVVGVGGGGVVLLSAAGPGCVGAAVVFLPCACACVGVCAGCGRGG